MLLLFSALALVYLATSIPIKLQEQSSKVLKLDVIRHPSLRERLIRNGTWATYRRSQESLEFFKNKASGTQSLVDYGDAEYLVRVGQGTPTQYFYVICDTGSSNYWLIDSSCYSAGCSGTGQYSHKKFVSSMSSTFQNYGDQIQMNYGKGSLSGYVATDVINLAGVTYSQQGFSLATQMSDDFAQTPIEGILGLAWPTLAVDGITPPMQNLINSLDRPVFTMYLQRHHSPVMGQVGGLMTLGGIDTQNCASNIQYVPITSQYYWQFTLGGWSIGSYQNRQSQQVIADTGTSLLIGPSSSIEAIAQTVGATYNSRYGVYVVSCFSASSLPDIVFYISGQPFNVPASEYVIDLGLGNGQCVVSIGAIDSMGFSMSWILGVTFMRTYCGIFDIGNQQIGFAKANNF